MWKPMTFVILVVTGGLVVSDVMKYNVYVFLTGSSKLVEISDAEGWGLIEGFLWVKYEGYKTTHFNLSQVTSFETHNT